MWRRVTPLGASAVPTHTSPSATATVTAHGTTIAPETRFRTGSIRATDAPASVHGIVPSQVADQIAPLPQATVAVTPPSGIEALTMFVVGSIRATPCPNLSGTQMLSPLATTLSMHIPHTAWSPGPARVIRAMTLALTGSIRAIVPVRCSTTQIDPNPTARASGWSTPGTTFVTIADDGSTRTTIPLSKSDTHREDASIARPN